MVFEPLVQRSLPLSPKHLDDRHQGAIGRGKSTIIKLLLGFCRPVHGDLYLEGKWYAELHVEDIRQRVAIVPQNAVLFNDSVVNNVLYGNEDRFTEEQIRAYIREYADEVPVKRMDAGGVGPGGQHLSGGQRQRCGACEYLRVPPPSSSWTNPRPSWMNHPRMQRYGCCRRR